MDNNYTTRINPRTVAENTCSLPSDPGISTKGEIIRDRMNRALDSAYKIKSILIGLTDNETINEDAPVTCLDDELNRIDAKLCRLNYILDEIVERL